MHFYVSTCSAAKSETEGKVPALARYLSPRIHSVAGKAEDDGLPFLILSGKYGLLTASQEIPWYDLKLEAEMVPLLIGKLAEQLKQHRAERITLYGCDPRQFPEWQPYVDALRQACRLAHVQFDYKIQFEDGL